MNEIHTMYQPRSRTLRNLAIAAATGFGVVVAGLFLAPERIWPAVLLANYYVLTLALAGTVFVALMHVSRAGWSTVFRRIPESMSTILPVCFGVMLLMVFGLSTLYEWSHPGAVAADPLLQGKEAWLNVPFFLIRIVLYFAIWIGFSSILRRNSRLQDSSGDERLTRRNMRFSALFIVLFALSFWLASTDWLMSLEPHWYSTIFSVYNFSGLILSGIATIIVILIMLRRRGVFGDLIRDSHLHDLGKLLFAFSTFWMYIWFSQYMLTWYANIPEFTVYYIGREQGGWLTFTWLNVVFNWGIPFVTLLSARAKKAEGLLLKVAIIVLIGHWIDLFWMIAPPFMPAAPVIGVWEIAPLVTALALFFFFTLRALSRGNVLPVQDPTLVESLHYHA
ncbi:MAG: hypothetical protein KFH87_03200 [Bacteroidetes bacterium]|nr:hypothetical protein [Bacteroidota bacterium]